MRWTPNPKSPPKPKPKWRRRFAFLPTTCERPTGGPVRVWLEFYERSEEFQYDFYDNEYGGKSLYTETTIHNRVVPRLEEQE